MLATFFVYSKLNFLSHICNVNKFNNMSSISQLVSEIAHSVKQADSIPVRKAIRLSIIHARNQLIRQSYTNHNYADKGLQQRFKVELIDVPDGDLFNSLNLGLDTIKRTKNKVPKPVRLTNNLPFQSVRTVGTLSPILIPFAREGVSQFYSKLPGLCSGITYDYINGYIYINITSNSSLSNIPHIIVESIFEQPHLIETETNEGILTVNNISDDDEFLLPEDMIDAVKKIVLDTWNVQVIRDTNEVSSQNKVQ